MAEVIILSPVAKVIIERLGSAAVEKIGSLWGVRDELKRLEDTLSTIRAVLLDAEKQQSHNDQVRLWLERLVDVVSEADDLVDEVATEGLRRELMPGKKVVKKVRIFFSSSNQLVYRNKFAKEIKDVRKRLAAIAADRRDFHLMESREETKPGRSGRKTCSFVVEENVVGRDEDKTAVLELLLEHSDRKMGKKVSVIPIVGMGGLGKTTLAQLVFIDVRIREHFQLRIWVCVSDDFDEKVLLGKIVESITKSSTKDDTMEKLQMTLHEEINGKRYLLVLDDVWNENYQKWQNLKGLLSNCGESGSWVIVTTQSEKIAELIGSVQPCRLGILGAEDSWSLFEKIAFERGQEPSEANVVDIAKEIVRKCGGVPLAIRMIGGMLSFRDPKTEWESFLEMELSSIPQEDGDILPTLKLSYDWLPSNLKCCFAYCSLFPKDYLIDVDKLIGFWMAQGFINVSSDGSQTLEDIGYDHFMELFWRSFFQEFKTNVKNKVTTCKMHDLFHDLAIQVAGKEYASLDPSQERSYIYGRVRHVSFSIEHHGVPSPLLQAKRLRSVHLQHFYGFKSGELMCEALISNFKLLRMLDLSGLKIKTLPNSIGKLKHLRYLDLSYNGIKTLPTSITKLVNLQTLKLNMCRKLRELPQHTSRLVNLRHLDFDTLSYMPKGLSQLTNIQTLSNFVVNNNPAFMSHCSKLDELMRLNNLRGRLEISGTNKGDGK